MWLMHVDLQGMNPNLKINETYARVVPKNYSKKAYRSQNTSIDHSTLGILKNISAK